MNDIFAFFENFDMPVLAADFNSGETVYMNRSAASLAECSISLTETEKSALACGTFLHRTFFSKPLGRTAEAETTLVEQNGRTLIFEIQNTAASAWAENAFCAAMQAEDPNRAPNIMLEKTGTSLKAERIYVCEKTSPDRFIRSCEWTAPNAAHSKEPSQIACAYLYNSFPQTDCIIVSENTAETADKKLCDILSERDVRSFAAIPLFEGEALTGFCCAENFPEEMCKNAAEILRRAAFFIGVCIKWSRLFADLKKMSLTDRLTGIGNRHAMNILEASLKTPTPLGLVFCDISGLKQINDTLGHCAGDDYIISACEIMKKIFRTEELFRIGGDELLAILTNTSETEILEKTAALKSELEASSIAMAVGSSFGTADNNSMNKLLLEAETKMYKDKTAYYIRTGRERRRS